MLHLMQLFRLIENKQLFIELFNDLSFELDELGYRDFPSDLVNEMLDNHFGIFMEDDRQLQRVTDCILSKQGKLQYLLYI